MSSIGLRAEDERGLARVPVAQGAPGSTEVAAAAAGKRNKITGGMLTISADGTFKITSGGTDLCGAMPIAAKSGFVMDADRDEPLFVSALGADLTVVTTGGAVSGILKIVTE